MQHGDLTGWTIGVTADRRAEEQEQLLTRLGARVVHGPAIKTVPLRPDSAIRPGIEAVLADPPHVLVLTTGLGTRALFEAADAIGLADHLLAALGGATVVARGPKAAGAAQTAGLDVVWQAESATGAELLAHLGSLALDGKRVAVQLDGRARPVLGDAIRALGARVVDLPVYEWHRPDDAEPALRLVAAACEGRLDAVTFTSSPAVWNLFAMAREVGRDADLRAALAGPVPFVSIGAVCSGAARAEGIEPAVEPERHRLGAMVRALGDHALAERDRRCAVVDGRPVELRAATVVVDGWAVDLAERDRDLLQVLLARPSAVVAKTALLRAVWPGTDDPHVVEVAMSRLRRRLEGHLAITTVPRRGYLLGAPPTAVGSRVSTA